MVGNRYWATGITVRFEQHPTTSVVAVITSMKFFDAGFCDDASTEGTLTLRYWVSDLTQAIDTLKTDAERLGIEFRIVGDMKPMLYVDGDGERDDVYLPADWLEQLQQQATRIGWITYESEEVNK